MKRDQDFPLHGDCANLAPAAMMSRAAAIVFGAFTHCAPGPDGVPVSDVLLERTATLAIPVLAGAPFGHGAPNFAFPLGARARLEGATLHFA